MLSLTNLNECFDRAVTGGYKYIGVRIAMKTEKEEVIINPRENFSAKKAYYNSVYDENLRHKLSGDNEIRITGFTYGDRFQDIEENLEFYQVTGSLN